MPPVSNLLAVSPRAAPPLLSGSFFGDPLFLFEIAHEFVRLGEVSWKSFEDGFPNIMIEKVRRSHRGLVFHH